MSPEIASDQRSFHATTAEALQSIATALGRALVVGDVIALSGPLGAGKTTFVQGLARGMGVATDRHVASPTFALVSEHPGRIDLVHVDFYRIKHPAELPELGLEEAYDRAATAIEWAERFPEQLPADHLRIRIAIEVDGARTLAATSLGPRSALLLRGWDTAVNGPR